MNLENLVKFEVRRDLEDWDKLNRLLKTREYFEKYEQREKPLVLKFGRFLKKYGVKKIIDSHTHSFTYEHFMEPRPVEGRISPALPVTSVPNSPAELVLWVCNEVYANGAGVPFEVVTFGLPIYNTDVPKQNEYVLSKSRKYAPRLHPFALTPPFSGSKLEKLVKAGFRGFKPYYLLRDIDFKKYLDMNVSDWLTDDILIASEESNLPIMLHIAPPTENAYREVAGMIKKHPNVKFILAHLGICHTIENFNKYARPYGGCENVFLETSNIQSAEVLEHAFLNFGESQLLYGSDLPFSLIRHGIVTITQKMVDGL